MINKKGKKGKKYCLSLLGLVLASIGCASGPALPQVRDALADASQAARQFCPVLKPATPECELLAGDLTAAIEAVELARQGKIRLVLAAEKVDRVYRDLEALGVDLP